MINIIISKFNSFVSDKQFSEILTGSVWAFSGNVIALVLAMIVSIVVARFYGPEVLGIVAVLNSFLILATIFTVMGTGTSILRLIPEHLAKYSFSSAFKIYRKTLNLVIIVSLFSATLFFLVSPLISKIIFNKPYLTYYFSLASVFIVFKSIMLLNTSAVRGFRYIRIFALMQSMPQSFNLLLLLILGLLVSNKNVPIYAMLGGFTLTGIMGWVILARSFKKMSHSHDQIHDVPVLEILSISMPMFMTASMNFAIGQTGVVMLGMFRSEAEVGFFAVAVKLANLTSFVLTAINSMAAPKFSELFNTGKVDELFHVARKSTKLIFWTTTPILLILILFGKPLILLMFGSDFIVAYLAMVFLVIGQFVHSISGSTGIFMNMTGHQIVYRNIILAAAFLNIILNIVLIPLYGIYGASISAMVCIVFWNITALIYIKVKFNKTIAYAPLINL